MGRGGTMGGNDVDVVHGFGTYHILRSGRVGCRAMKIFLSHFE